MFESAGWRTAVVVSDDPLQGQQMERIVRTFGQHHGRVFCDPHAATAWAQTGTPSPDSAANRNPSGAETP
jgi:hypothetical protein